MIKVVNDSLFKFATEKCTNDFGEYFKTMVQSPVISAKSERLARIATITASSINYNSANTAVLTKVTDSGNVNLLLKASEKNQFDSNVILIAFPFNGLAGSIPESKQFRIHKGTIVVSGQKPIELRGERYKKIFYLAIEINTNLGNSTTLPFVQIPFVSYNLMTQKDKTTKTIKETMLVNVSYETGDIDVAWTSDEIEPINREDINKTPLFVRYEQKARIGAEKTPIYQKSNTSFDKTATRPTNRLNPSAGGKPKAPYAGRAINKVGK